MHSRRLQVGSVYITGMHGARGTASSCHLALLSLCARVLRAPAALSPLTCVPHLQVLACNRQIYAMKRVRLANKDPEAIRGFIDEIALLKKLRNTPNIIQLINAQVSCILSSRQGLLGISILPNCLGSRIRKTLANYFKPSYLLGMPWHYGKESVHYLLHNRWKWLGCVHRVAPCLPVVRPRVLPNGCE